MRAAIAFAKFAFTLLMFAVFGVWVILAAVLLFGTGPLARGAGHRRRMKQDWSIPVWKQ